MQLSIFKEFGKALSQEKDIINFWKRNHKVRLKNYNNIVVIKKRKRELKFFSKSSIYFKGLLLKMTQ
jgi:hypothetical protein